MDISVKDARELVLKLIREGQDLAAGHRWASAAAVMRRAEEDMGLTAHQCSRVLHTLKQDGAIEEWSDRGRTYIREVLALKGGA